jgi:hypothetical protein
MKSKARKCVREYESKLEELKNECHEAWITLQDSNRINEMLRDDLVAKSLCVDSLGMSFIHLAQCLAETFKMLLFSWLLSLNLILSSYIVNSNSCGDSSE